MLITPMHRAHTGGSGHSAWIAGSWAVGKLVAGLALLVLGSCGGDPEPVHLPVAARLLQAAAAPHAVSTSSLLRKPRSGGGLSVADTPAIGANDFLDWAERQFSQYFQPPAQPLALTGWTVRFYATAALYLGVSD